VLTPCSSAGSARRTGGRPAVRVSTAGAGVAFRSIASWDSSPGAQRWASSTAGASGAAGSGASTSSDARGMNAAEICAASGGPSCSPKPPAGKITSRGRSGPTI
jgi:hypothetical protein